jgi:DNA-binding protein YbaB
MDMQSPLSIMLEEYRAARARIDRLQAAAQTMRVSVRSPDRSTTVTVDAAGVLQDLRIDAGHAARMHVDDLAEAILGASRLAAAQARERLRASMREALPERLRDLVGADGSVDLAALLPLDPRPR